MLTYYDRAVGIVCLESDVFEHEADLSKLLGLLPASPLIWQWSSTRRYPVHPRGRPAPTAGGGAAAAGAGRAVACLAVFAPDAHTGQPLFHHGAGAGLRGLAVLAGPGRRPISAFRPHRPNAGSPPAAGNRPDRAVGRRPADSAGRTRRVFSAPVPGAGPDRAAVGGVDAGRCPNPQPGEDPVEACGGEILHFYELIKGTVGVRQPGNHLHGSAQPPFPVA